MPLRRPFSVTLLLWLVLILSAWGAIRFEAARRWWDVLNEFDSRLSPIYLAATGIVWCIIGIVLFWGIFRRKGWSRIAALAGMFAWQAELWIELVLSVSQISNTIFATAASCLFLGVIIALTLHRSTKLYLQ